MVFDMFRKAGAGIGLHMDEPVAPDAPKVRPRAKRKGRAPDVSKIRDKFEIARSARAEIEQVWLVNKAFIRSEQWQEQDERGRLIRQRKEPWKKYSTFNKLYNHRRVLVSKRIAQDHVPIVVPTTSEESDRSLARAQEALLKWVLRENDYEQERVYHATEAVETGDSWWRLDWDADGGTPLEIDPEARAAAEADGLKDFDANTSGTLKLRSVSPLEMYVEPGALRLQDARWLIQAQPMHVDTIYEKWGKEVPADQSAVVLTTAADTYLDGQSRSIGHDMATVIEFWLRPNKDFPNGLYAVVAGEQCLDWEDELPEWGFPFVFCPYDPDPDSFHGTTPVTDAVLAQREFNQNLSMIFEARNHDAFPTIMEPAGCNLTPATGIPGESRTYNASVGTPWSLQRTPINPQIFELTGMLSGLINELVGNNESSMGMMPSGAGDSGRAIAFAAEKDEVKLAASHKVYRSATKQMLVLSLKMLRHYGKGKMLVPVLGQNAASDIEEFELADISFRDVEVFVDQSMPSNPSAKREQALMWLQAGAITHEEFRKLLELGDDHITTSRNPVKERARHENRMLYQTDVRAEMFEDHAIHLQIHLDEMNQARNYTAPAEVRARFQYHLQEHLMMMQGMPVDGEGAPQDIAQPEGAPGEVGPMPPAQGELPVSENEAAVMDVISGEAPVVQ